MRERHLYIDRAHRRHELPGLLFTALLVRLLPGGEPLYLLPLEGDLSDLLENVTIAALALGHEDSPPTLVSLATAFTLVKTVLVAAMLAVAFAKVARWVWTRRRHGH